MLKKIINFIFKSSLVLTGFVITIIIGILAGYFLITINTQKPLVIVPNVIGKDASQAVEILLQKGLEVRSIEEVHSALEAGKIFAQQPLPGVKVKVGRGLKLYKSLGRKEIMVPNLIGKELMGVELALREVGLEMGEIARVYHNSIPKDQVIAQAPLPKSQAVKGQKVDLLLSLGKKPISLIMPDLRLKKEAEGKKILQGLNLGIGVEYRLVPEGEETGIIEEQFPFPGEKVDQGEEVTLIVTKKEKEASSNIHFSILDFNIPLAIKKGEIKAIIQDERGWSCQLKKVIPGPQRVLLLIYYYGSAESWIFQDDQLIERKILLP